jgi:hypothetical protein
LWARSFQRFAGTWGDRQGVDFSSTLTSITIPASVTSLGNYAFLRCISLISVTVLATVPPTVFAGANPFLACPTGLQIHVPAASVSAYKSATGWSAFASQIVGF